MSVPFAFGQDQRIDSVPDYHFGSLAPLWEPVLPAGCLGEETPLPASEREMP